MKCKIEFELSITLKQLFLGPLLYMRETVSDWNCLCPPADIAMLEFCITRKR